MAKKLRILSPYFFSNIHDKSLANKRPRPEGERGGFGGGGGGSW
jgi:hypothetical protein